MNSYVHGDRIERVVAHHAARTPDAPAVAQGGLVLSYRDLVDRADSVAAGLLDRGVRPGQHVAVRMARTPDLVVALLGVLRAGAAYLAIDPGWPAGRVAAVLDGASVALCVTDLADFASGGRPPWPELDGSATACIFYTSGSTGQPKGVPSPHRGTIRNLVGNPTIPLDSGTVFLQAAPLPWDGLSLELWAPLLNGGRCVLLDPDLPSLDAHALASAVRDGVNSVWLTSSLFTVIAEERLDVFGGLRLLLAGGERVSVSSARRVLTRYPDLHMVNGYGPVESTIFATTHVVRPVDIAPDSTEIPIGKPVPHTEIMLLDGEIVVGGDGVASGYLGNPAETERRFRTVDGTRFYRTGDLAIRDDDGLLRYRGRTDHQFKIRGVRIEAGEVEAVLEAHPSVSAACVLPVTTAPGRVHLAAAYTTVDGRPAELHAHARASLLDAMVPTVLRHVDQLPRNANGKTDRAAVARLLAERIPDVVSDGTVLGDVRALLGMPWLGEQDDLFAAGATSLDLIRIAARLDRPLADVYRLRTVDAIARSDAQDVATTSSDTLTHAEQRFWLAEMSAPGSCDNMLVLAYRLTGPLDTDRLAAALHEVVLAHPALRTTYPWHGDAPVRHVIAPAAAKVVIEHVAGTSVEAVTADWWHLPFDLETDVPLRVRLCRLADESHLLCLHVHHIAFDGWSESVLIDDLGAAYAGRPLPDRGGVRERIADERDLPFWRERTARPPAPFLPAPRGHGEAARRELVTTVDAGTVAALGVPALGALVAAAGRAFARTFGVTELAVGSVSAGRDMAGVESTVGYFVNPFLVRLSDLSRSAVTAEVLAALGHAVTPFDELVRVLGPDRTRHPWFQAWVVLQRQPPRGVFGDVTVEPVRIPPPATATELIVEAIPVPDGSWQVVIAWRDDGIGVDQARSVERALGAALREMTEQ